MKRMRSATVAIGACVLGLSGPATAFAPVLENSAPQKVAREGGCVFPIVSPDGLWSACVDSFGQIVDLFTPDQPFSDNVFETLLYEASFPHSGGLSRRVEANFVVSAGPIVSTAGDSTWTRLTKSVGGMSIEITNRMINGPAGGVQVQIRCENKGPQPITCKLFYYCDFNISNTFLDDEATPLFDGTGRLVGIEQIDFLPPNKPLLFGGCPNYKSWQIDLFPTLQLTLDAGVPQLASADFTLPGPADHTAALASDEVLLEPGQSTTMEVGIGGPGFSTCKSKCPYDCDGSNDGIVGITDFLALLGQWGTPGAPCDKAGGDAGVGIVDFLGLLGSWGPCPVNTVKCCLPIDLEAYCADPNTDPPEACVDADSCADCAALGGLCVEECNLVEQTITVVDEISPAGSYRHSTWTALVCAPKAPCVCGNLIDALFTPATPCGGSAQGSHVQFGTPEIPPIPADFFGPGSDPFVGEICLKGEPLGATPFGTFEVADTLIRRTADPFECGAPFPANAVIPIEIVALSLVSIDPVTVTFNGGQNPQQWDVQVNLSQAVPQQQGFMDVQKTHPNGGVFLSELPVIPLFIFSEVGNPGNVRVFDTALKGFPPILLNNGKSPTDWVHDVKLGTLAPEGPPSCFNPGINEDNP